MLKTKPMPKKTLAKPKPVPKAKPVQKPKSEEVYFKEVSRETIAELDNALVGLGTKVQDWGWAHLTEKEKEARPSIGEIANELAVLVLSDITNKIKTGSPERALTLASIYNLVFSKFEIADIEAMANADEENKKGI